MERMWGQRRLPPAKRDLECWLRMVLVPVRLDSHRGVPHLPFIPRHPCRYKCTSVCCVPASDDCVCSCLPNEDENMDHLSTVGWLFTIGLTYFGFSLLTVGIMWNAQVGRGDDVAVL